MKLIVYTDDFRKVNALEYGQALLPLSLKKVLGHSALTVAVSGSDQSAIGSVALWLLSEGHRVVLRPTQVPLPTDIVIDIEMCFSTNKTLFIFNNRKAVDLSRNYSLDWRLCMASSGSTGDARYFAYTWEQLVLTAGWYHKIYEASTESVAVCALPTAYNFCFIGGWFQSAVLGSNLLICNQDRLGIAVPLIVPSFSRAVVLANPLIVEQLGSIDCNYDRILVDSGGSPLATECIRLMRAKGFDLREGYGLTETCSLTHFDIQGTNKSLGSVGPPMTGVEHKVETCGSGRPSLLVRSRNRGTAVADLIEQRTSMGDWLRTGDLGCIDADDSLRVLGRCDDWEINGWWPRDVLDLIGPALGMKHAQIRHPSPNSVSIRLHASIDRKSQNEISSRVIDCLKIEPSNIHVEQNVSPLLHSKKLDRVPPVS